MWVPLSELTVYHSCILADNDLTLVARKSCVMTRSVRSLNTTPQNSFTFRWLAQECVQSSRERYGDMERVGDHEKIKKGKKAKPTICRLRSGRFCLASAQISGESARGRHSSTIASREQNYQLRMVNSSEV